MKYFFTSILSLIFFNGFSQADVITELEANHKACVQIKYDSVACARVYFYALDSMMNIVFLKAKESLSGDERTDLIKDQLSWAAKKETFFKKQDQNFVYNIQEGTWKKEMIRVPYEEKAYYLLKRIKFLLKKLIE